MAKIEQIIYKGILRDTIDLFNIEGIIADCLTPFHHNGDINPEFIKHHAEYLEDYSITGVFILGYLGEGPSMTVEERKTIAAAWMKAKKKKLKQVIVQVGTGNLRETMELAKHAESIKASAIACHAPTGIRAKDEADMVEYLLKVESAAPNTPLYYYSVDHLTRVYLKASQILKLGFKRVRTLRGAILYSGEMGEVLDCTVIRDGETDTNILIGGDEYLLPALTVNVTVPVLSPFFGADFRLLKEHFTKGKHFEARLIQEHFNEFWTTIRKYGDGPALQKAVMKQYPGGDFGPVRPPLREIKDSKLPKIKKLMTSCMMFETPLYA